VRRCIACGRRAPQRELLRFVAVGEYSPRRLVLDPAYRAPGRGAYVCAGTTCFERARERRAFQRAMRTRGAELLIDQGLAASLAA
jgi:predicted RNA-binding protein YlxR (DUF448 family)